MNPFRTWVLVTHPMKKQTSEGKQQKKLTMRQLPPGLSQQSTIQNRKMRSRGWTWRPAARWLEPSTPSPSPPLGRSAVALSTGCSGAGREGFQAASDASSMAFTSPPPPPILLQVGPSAPAHAARKWSKSALRDLWTVSRGREWLGILNNWNLFSTKT